MPTCTTTQKLTTSCDEPTLKNKKIHVVTSQSHAAVLFGKGNANAPSRRALLSEGDSP